MDFGTVIKNTTATTKWESYIRVSSLEWFQEVNPTLHRIECWLTVLGSNVEARTFPCDRASLSPGPGFAPEGCKVACRRLPGRGCLSSGNKTDGFQVVV